MQQREQAHALQPGSRRVKRSAMPAGLVSLRDDRVRASVARTSRSFREGCRCCEPRDATFLQTADAKEAENTPMIEETAVGASSRNVSHCASKSGGIVSPADGGTGGPHASRNLLICISAPGSLRGRGSVIQTFNRNGPLLLLALNSSTQDRISAGGERSAPIAPIPPAFATAIDRLAGHAPAIGASMIGSLRPNFAQNRFARSSGRAFAMYSK